MNLADPSLVQTPARVARAYADLLTPREFTPTTFPNDEHCDETRRRPRHRVHVDLRASPAAISGTAVVGYPAGQRIMGLSSSPA